MLDYPEPTQAYPSDWIQELMEFKDTKDLVALERKDFSAVSLSGSLRAFVERSEFLGQFESAPRFHPMPENSYTFLYVIPKKQHEIRSLAPFVHHTYKSQKLSSVVDIGGGIGALAQVLNRQYELQMHSVDMDPVLQNTGMLRQKRMDKNRLTQVQYHEHKVAHDNEEFKKLLGPGTLTLGLHTCGDLSVHQMRSTIETKSKVLINFGCCYNRLVDTETQNLSHYARSLPSQIIQNKFALTLAARAHRKTDEEDYSFKLKVKYFRYTFHLLMCDEFGMPEMMTLGNSSKKLYDAPFNLYAEEQFRRLGLTPPPSEKLNAYFENSERKELIREMLTAGFIRNVFGRLLEAYILLDRAIFMEESGYDSQLLQFFEEEISPRNLGLVCQLR